MNNANRGLSFECLVFSVQFAEELCVFYVREWPTSLNDLFASFFLSTSSCTGKAGRQNERGRKMNTDEVQATFRKESRHSPLRLLSGPNT